MPEIMHFKISSGLKDIIGRELINSKYIAIFELVKNSYDANATKVNIIFENVGLPNAKIIISDNGTGMNKDAIINKWLFVAYSEKKYASYRDRIRKREYAGAKGVGRFSCDRLGSRVILTSKTIDDLKSNRICINWNDFEVNSRDNFSDINVEYESRANLISEQGTIIEISDLREQWDRTDILSLKKALTQLVNPGATKSYDDFRIYLNVPSELKNDKEEKEERNKVNGPIKNYVFETLDIKTTKIFTEISEDGKTIFTYIDDRGIPLISLTEKNTFTLRNISCTIYHLNRSAKINFHKIMGTESVNYGSIFVYKNGFRVYPYGEPDQDFFNIDQRKSQGFKRYLGTRDIIGQICINGDTNNLIETSSRNSGFINSNHYKELVEFFYEFALKPLEKYVVGIVAWGEVDVKNSLLGEEDYFNGLLKKLKPKIKEENILDSKISDEIINILRENEKKQPSAIASEIKEIALRKNDTELYEKVVDIERKTIELENNLRVTAQEQERTQNELEYTSEKLEYSEKQIQILKTRVELTADEALSAMHIMKGYADSIDSVVFELFEELSRYKEAQIAVQSFLADITQACTKIKNSYNLVINTDYTASTDVKRYDLIKFINNYINLPSSFRVKIVIENKNNMIGNVKFNPLEFSIIIDNIISNSQKANARNLWISFKLDSNYLIVYFRDDGIGLKNKDDFMKIFEPGFTRTGGTGLGLYTVEKYVKKIGGNVHCNPQYSNGFEIVLRLKLWI